MRVFQGAKVRSRVNLETYWVDVATGKLFNNNKLVKKPEKEKNMYNISKAEYNHNLKYKFVGD